MAGSGGADSNGLIDCGMAIKKGRRGGRKSRWQPLCRSHKISWCIFYPWLHCNSSLGGQLSLAVVTEGPWRAEGTKGGHCLGALTKCSLLGCIGKQKRNHFRETPKCSLQVPGQGHRHKTPKSSRKQIWKRGSSHLLIENKGPRRSLDTDLILHR